MTEWNVLYADREGGEFFLVLPSFRKLLIWFVCTAWRCTDIKIFIG